MCVFVLVFNRHPSTGPDWSQKAVYWLFQAYPDDILIYPSRSKKSPGRRLQVFKDKKRSDWASVVLAFGDGYVASVSWRIAVPTSQGWLQSQPKTLRRLPVNATNTCSRAMLPKFTKGTEFLTCRPPKATCWLFLRLSAATVRFFAIARSYNMCVFMWLFWKQSAAVFELSVHCSVGQNICQKLKLKTLVQRSSGQHNKQQNRRI